MIAATRPPCLNLECERAVAVTRQLKDDELEWLGGSDPDFRNKLPLVHDPGRIVGLVAMHEESLLFRRALESPGAVKRTQKTADQVAYLRAKRYVVGLEHHPLTLAIEGFSNHRD